MDEMLTINPWINKEKALYIIKDELKRLHIRKARINFKTIYRKKHFDELFDFINQAHQVNDEIEWYFDIGIPGDTLRLVIPKQPYNIVAKSGKQIRVYYNHQGNYETNKEVYIRKARVPNGFEALFQKGKTFLYGDGENEFVITDVHRDYFEAIAMNSGTIWDGKAIVFPGEKTITQYVRFSYLEQYFERVSGMERNSIICSMVENANQIVAIRKSSPYKIISKVESSLGINNLESISRVSDGVMLGRGDLFLGADSCLHYWKMQKVFLDFISREKDVNSIVATNILDSFKDGIIPSRSDITDVFFLMAHNPKTVCLSGSVFFSENIEKCVSFLREFNNTNKTAFFLED